ncbi:MAG: phosphopantetheine-binding protein [Opitutaceae bacterium]
MRGHRIELGEVESTLSRIAGVEHAAVVVIDKGDGDKHLAAFLVTPKAAPLDITELRWELAQHLPAPAIPAEFHFCIQLPVTSNGKVDRKALTAKSAMNQTRARLAARGSDRSIEDVVAEAWLEGLGLAQLDRAANVFEHGATSLTVARVHRMLEARLDRTFSVTLLFQHTSIRALAEKLSNPQHAARSGAIARAREQRAALARRRPALRR